MIETQIVEIWIAEAGNGSVIFDTEPNDSTVHQVCEYLTGEIKLYAVTATVAQSSLVGTYHNPDPDDEELYQ